jgi:hypothetical protein
LLFLRLIFFSFLGLLRFRLLLAFNFNEGAPAPAQIQRFVGKDLDFGLRFADSQSVAARLDFHFNDGGAFNYSAV